MERNPRAYLWDVLQAADAIDRFSAGLDAVGYAENALVRSAVERQFEIIGEALHLNPAVGGTILLKSGTCLNHLGVASKRRFVNRCSGLAVKSRFNCRI